MATELREALTASGASALIQKVIDPVLVEVVRRFSPMLQSTADVKWTSNIYNWNQRTVLPNGGFVTDGGTRPLTTSTYVQTPVTIRNMQVVGGVTGYAQAVTADLIGSLRAKEIEGAAKSLAWSQETAMLWGNAAATVNDPYPQFDGLDVLVSQFAPTTANPFVNAINFAGANFSLGTLDQLIDLVESNLGMSVENPSYMFIMSPTSNSRLSQLLVNQQRFNDKVTIAAGLIVPTYRDVPIIKSSFLSPRTNIMPTVSTSVAGAGSLADATYYYQVSCIMQNFGEIQACPEVNGVVVSGNAGTITLSFTPPTNSGPNNASPILYKVFRSTSTGTETLLGYVDAVVSSADGGLTTILTNQIVDNGVTLIPQNSTGPTQPATTVAAYTGTNTGIIPLGTGEQNIYLIPRDPDFLVRPYVRGIMPVDIYPTTASPDSLPFALVADTVLAVRAPEFLGRAAGVSALLSN